MARRVKLKKSSCNGIAACECGHIWPCPFGPDEDHKHPVELVECENCRTRNGMRQQAPLVKEPDDE